MRMDSGWGYRESFMKKKNGQQAHLGFRDFFLYLFIRIRFNALNICNFFLRFFPYNVSCIAAFLIKMIPFVLIRHFAGLNVVVCNLLALAVSGLFNFIMNEWVIFRKKS